MLHGRYITDLYNRLFNHPRNVCTCNLTFTLLLINCTNDCPLIETCYVKPQNLLFLLITALDKSLASKYMTFKADSTSIKYTSIYKVQFYVPIYNINYNTVSPNKVHLYIQSTVLCTNI